MIYDNVLTLFNGRKTWVSLKSFFHKFKLSYNEDIIAEADCLTLMAGFSTDQGIRVDGCLRII